MATVSFTSLQQACLTSSAQDSGCHSKGQEWETLCKQHRQVTAAPKDTMKTRMPTRNVRIQQEWRQCMHLAENQKDSQPISATQQSAQETTLTVYTSSASTKHAWGHPEDSQLLSFSPRRSYRHPNQLWVVESSRKGNSNGQSPGPAR